jgi:hypothetical protein
MPRGGQRVGAGRNHKLSFWHRMAIGGACQSRFRELWKRATDDAWARRPGTDRLRYLQKKNRQSAPHSKERDALSAQIEKVVREMRRTPSFAKTNRHFSIVGRRPKGVSDKICEEVAAEFAARWGRDDLGPRYARRCWNEFRRFEKDTEPGDPDPDV